ncbi:MAG: hypothetical protein ACRC7S_07510 [Cetobacterium sp.]
MDLKNRYIKVTRDNEMEVLKALEELGFTWCDGFKPTQWSTFNNSTGDVHFIQTIGEREINFCSTERFLDDYVKNKEFNLAYLKSLCRDEKLEQPKVIRKLKDLDGLKNDKGWELSFESTDNFKDKGYYQEWVRLDDKSNKGWFNAFYELTDKTIDLLKIGGFEFEYKPLRKLEEVRDEIKSIKSLEFNMDGDNFFIAKTDKEYYVENYNLIDILGVIYMQKEQAQKYVDELNEIVGGK